MATVELSFTPLPAHVRTARLVATAVARRSRVEESLLDEVRLAVGEACSRAVEAHRMHCPTEPVRIALSDRDGRFEVVVSDTVPSGADARTPSGQGERDRAGIGQGGGYAAAGVPGTSDPGGPQPGKDLPGGAQPGGPESAGAQPGGPESAGAQPGGAEVRGAASTAGNAGMVPGVVPGETDPGGSGTDTGSAGGAAADSAVDGGLPADIGLAVIEGLAEDVHISATSRGVTIRMSWPAKPPA